MVLLSSLLVLLSYLVVLLFCLVVLLSCLLVLLSLSAGPAVLSGCPAVLCGGSAVLSGGPAVLCGGSAVLSDDSALAGLSGGPGGPAVLLVVLLSSLVVLVLLVSSGCGCPPWWSCSPLSWSWSSRGPGVLGCNETVAEGFLVRSRRGQIFFKPVLFLESNVTSIGVTVGYVILLGRLQGFFSTAVGAASLHRRGLPQGTLYVQEYSFSHVFARVLCQME